MACVIDYFGITCKYVKGSASNLNSVTLRAETLCHSSLTDRLDCNNRLSDAPKRLNIDGSHCRSVVCWDCPRSTTHSWMWDFNPGLCRLSARWTLYDLTGGQARGETRGTRPHQSARRTRPLHGAEAGMKGRVNPQQQHGLPRFIYSGF